MLLLKAGLLPPPAWQGPCDPMRGYEAWRQLLPAKGRSLCLIPKSSPGLDQAKLRLALEPWV